MNMILLTIDCLRADHLSCLGYSKKTTPNLDDFASTGLLFSQAISVGPSTPPSFIAIHTSTYPLMHGGELYISDSRLTLAQALKEQGYHTAAFHSNPWVSSHYNYNKGFNTFDDGIKQWKAVQKPRALVNQPGWTGRVLTPLAQLYKMTMASNIYGNLFSNAQTLNGKAVSWLEKNPESIVEDGALLIIGRQIATNLGSYIDLLALDREGNTAILELKRDRTPRDTIAQAL